MAGFLRRHSRGNDEAHLEQIDGIKRRFEILGRLEAGPKALKAATAGLSDEALRRQPAPGKWSILEIACHLRDVERVSWNASRRRPPGTPRVLDDGQREVG